MPSIYDVAARLDNTGIMAPARMNAARIAISEQAAREAPVRFQQEQKQWQRADEQYAQGQMLFKQQQTFTKAAQIAAVSQTPQAFARNLQRVLGDQISDPYWSSVLNEASTAAGDPLAWQRMKSEIGSSMTNVGNLFASQLKMREEQAQQDAMTRRSMYEQGELNRRSASEIGGRERVANINAASREKVANIAANARLATAGANAKRKGVSATELSRLKSDAWKDIERRYWTEDGWSKDAPFMDVKVNRIFPNEYNVNQQKLESMVDAYVNETLNKSQALSGESAPAAGAKPKFSIMGNP